MRRAEALTNQLAVDFEESPGVRAFQRKAQFGVLALRNYGFQGVSVVLEHLQGGLQLLVRIARLPADPGLQLCGGFYGLLHGQLWHGGAPFRFIPTVVRENAAKFSILPNPESRH